MLLQKSRNNDRQAFASMALLVFGCAMATLLMIALGVSLPTDHDVDVYTATEARDDRLMLDLAWDLDQIKELSPSSRLKRLERVATEAENLLGAMVHNRTETLDLAAEGVSAEFEDDQIPRAILHDRDSHDLKVEVEIGSRAQALAADRDAQAAAQAQAATQAKASGAREATAQMMEVHA